MVPEMGMDKSFPLIKTNEYDFTRNLLLRKIQHASINRQIKKRIGLTLWRILFKGCHYEVDSGQITIMAPNERVAGIISNRYRTSLEKLFNARVSVRSLSNDQY